jgi:hypothetical protein
MRIPPPCCVLRAVEVGARTVDIWLIRSITGAGGLVNPENAKIAWLPRDDASLFEDSLIGGTVVNSRCCPRLSRYILRTTAVGAAHAPVSVIDERRCCKPPHLYIDVNRYNDSGSKPSTRREIFTTGRVMERQSPRSGSFPRAEKRIS